MSSYYGDGNSYRGVVCRESQTPTIVYRSGDEVVTLLEQRIRELESALAEAMVLLADLEFRQDETYFHTTSIHEGEWIKRAKALEPPQ